MSFRNSLSACLLLILSTASASSAQAGVANGGGGKDVVCRNKDGSIRSVTLLDLWEGGELRHQTPLRLAGRLDENVYKLIERVGPLWGGDLDPSRVPEIIRREASPFLSPNANIVWLTAGSGLNLTEDSGELIHPRQCPVEQVVNYQADGQQILIDKILYGKMNLTNRAALVLHEAVYKTMRFLEGDENSIRARRIVSYVLSHEAPLATPRPLEWEEGQIVCSGRTEGDESMLSIRNTVIVFSKDHGTMDFRSLNGALPKAYSQAAREPKAPWMDFFRSQYLDDSQCQDIRFFFGLDGPVEYDTTVELVKECRDGKLVRRAGVKRPGEKVFQYADLHCRPLQKGEWGD